jgi:hypothetical protein
MPPATKAKKTTLENDKANIIVRLYGGDRDLLPKAFTSTVRIIDGNQKLLLWKEMKGNTTQYRVPFYNNLFDQYTVLVTAKDHVDAGFYPINVSPEVDQYVDIMLLRDDAVFRFLQWSDIKTSYGTICSFLCCGKTAGDAEKTFTGLMKTKPPAAASLLNLATAMSSIHLPSGSPLEYFKEILWDDSLAQDRFFAYADAALVNQVKMATQQGTFVPEPHPGLFHPDATSSFKQVQFGEANVQITFHENSLKTINGVNCVKVEPDIDCFKDLGAHAILEVIPNTVTHGLTDPRQVYMLRWIAGRHAGVPEFNPPYTIL